MKRIRLQEFRNDLEKYISVGEPFAVTHHSQTVGYFLPTHKKSEQIESLKIAAEKLDRLFVDRGITENELVEEFHQLQQEEKKSLLEVLSNLKDFEEDIGDIDEAL
ncbi:MAG: type II toxin-antitoxin system Phd/YefM family antitoxin [Cyanobacteria bacterium P01_G01_bin.19]